MYTLQKFKCQVRGIVSVYSLLLSHIPTFPASQKRLEWSIMSLLLYKQKLVFFGLRTHLQFLTIRFICLRQIDRLIISQKGLNMLDL